METMKRMPDNFVDLVLTDPPYGIGYNSQEAFRGKKRAKTSDSYVKYKKYDWDNIKISEDVFKEIFRISKNQAIFGANYYSDYLPQSNGWIFWDKLRDKTFNFSHGELIWLSINQRVKKLTQSPVDESRGGLDRVHPTQKPIKLIRYILSQFNNIDIVYDPFIGSGTTAVACELEG